jgi:pimeloyl-ACP methyl ester carboxylesterase
MSQPLYTFGGDGPIMHVALANGFPPQTYAPLLQPFTKKYRVVCLPPRALWTDDLPAPDKPGSWRTLADDLLAGLSQYDLTDVTAVGHSFGGIASLLAVLDEPQRFRALILLDPTILPPDWLQWVANAKLTGEIEHFPLVQSAVRRRRNFESVDEAYAYFKTRPLFADWPDETVHLYAESITRPSGDGVELAWTPEWEAHYYRSMYTEIWEALPHLKGLLPTLFIRGGTTDTFREPSVSQVQALVPDATYVEIPGHGHLFPQSAPDETRQIMENWLETKSAI